MSDEVTKLAGTCEAHCSRRHYLAEEVLRAERERNEARVALAEALRQLSAAPEYRLGLPSVEQVRAHEKRGGWWLGRIEKRPRRWPDALRFVNMIVSGELLLFSDGNDGHFFTGYEGVDEKDRHHGPVLGRPLGDWDDEEFLVRYAWCPCLTNGKPCPWIDR